MTVLTQLVAQGASQTSKNYAADNVVPIGEKFETFESTKTFVVPRIGDSAEDFFLEVSVKALPEGYRWRQWAPKRFVDRSEISIGDKAIKYQTVEAQMIGLFLLKNSMFKESEMEYLDPKKEHTFLLPLSSNELPLVALQLSEVRQKIILNSLKELIETDMPTMCENPLKSAQLQCRYRFFDIKERREVAVNPAQYGISMRQTATSTFDILDHTVKFQQEQEGISSATLIHITAEDGSELSEPIVTNLSMLLQGEPRHKLTGTLSRIYHRELFRNTARNGSQCRDNELSKNLQQFVHTTGRLDVEWRLQGLNFSRIADTKFELQFNEKAPTRVRITVANEISNILCIRDGMASLKQLAAEPYFGPNKEVPTEKQNSVVSEANVPCLSTCTIG